ncbi:hypothetical protein BLOT_002718 [Blomia tropicalis]|nr:hypothetical protein BLOT_002718 [Blomia tropicalis]
MFSIDEHLKGHVLSHLTPGSQSYNLLNNYWDQLVVYLLMCPLQWIHLLHILYWSEWLNYGFATKFAVTIYIVFALIFWEVCRILAFHAIRTASQCEDISELVVRAATCAQLVGMQGYEVAKPQLDKAVESLTNLAGRIRESASKLRK